MSTTIFRKKDLEGEVVIDHRAAPLTEADAAVLGLPFTSPKERRFFEAATSTCSHCDRIVVMNPERTRERAHCPQCDHYICDECGTTYKLDSTCRCWPKRLDEYFKSLKITTGVT